MSNIQRFLILVTLELLWEIIPGKICGEGWAEEMERRGRKGGGLADRGVEVAALQREWKERGWGGAGDGFRTAESRSLPSGKRPRAMSAQLSPVVTCRPQIYDYKLVL